MKIIIIGAGQVGSFLASELCDDHDVVIIENDKERYLKIQDSLDLMAVHDEGGNPKVLAEAGIKDADVFLAVSGDDRANILSSLFASSLGLQSVVCRIRNEDYVQYTKLLENKKIQVINPSKIIASKLSDLISHPFAWKTEIFGENDEAELFKLKVEEGAEIAGKCLSELEPASSWIFVGVSRGGKITIPSGDTKLEAGDYVFALGDPESMERLKGLFNLKMDSIRSAIILGGGRLGRTVAATLLKKNMSVRIIENDTDRAKMIAGDIPEVTVFNGDATDAECLKEAGVESTDYLAALTGDDEKNVLSALLAKNLGVKQTTVLYTNPDYIDVLEAIGVNRAISVRLVIANEILSLLHIGGVAHITLLEEGRGEVLEFEIQEGSEVIGKTLQDIDFPKESIVGICIRDGEIKIPRGDFIPQFNDRLVVFTLSSAVKKVEQIFK